MAINPPVTFAIQFNVSLLVVEPLFLEAEIALAISRDKNGGSTTNNKGRCLYKKASEASSLGLTLVLTYNAWLNLLFTPTTVLWWAVVRNDDYRLQCSINLNY